MARERDLGRRANISSSFRYVVSVIERESDFTSALVSYFPCQYFRQHSLHQLTLILIVLDLICPLQCLYVYRCLLLWIIDKDMRLSYINILINIDNFLRELIQDQRKVSKVYWRKAQLTTDPFPARDQIVTVKSRKKSKVKSIKNGITSVLLRRLLLLTYSDRGQ